MGCTRRDFIANPKKELFELPMHHYSSLLPSPVSCVHRQGWMITYNASGCFQDAWSLLLVASLGIKWNFSFHSHDLSDTVQKDSMSCFSLFPSVTSSIFKLPNKYGLTDGDRLPAKNSVMFLCGCVCSFSKVPHGLQWISSNFSPCYGSISSHHTISPHSIT